MGFLIAGLVAFLGIHLVRVIAPGWREARIAAWGAPRWKAAYAILSLAAFALLVWGYGQARAAPVLIWVPPVGLRHAAALLLLPAFVLLVAAYLPGNAIQRRLGHPMLLGTKLWAAAHLLVSGWLHAMLVFGAFLVWAIVTFRSARRRPAAAERPASAVATAATLLLGLAAWVAFAFWGHRWLIGVAPFGG